MSRRSPTIINPEGRPTCYSCMRPQTHCVCNLIEPFAAHCKILILQHPHERKKYYSTAKLVVKGLSNARLIRGLQFNPETLAEVIVPEKTFLLYPSAEAVDCESVVLTPTDTVVVLDGTWSEAGKLLRHNPILRTLPALTFKREFRSNYRIRKQPKDRYLSTLECIGHLLKLSAGAGGAEVAVDQYDRLFRGFDQMIEQQLKHFPRSSSLQKRVV